MTLKQIKPPVKMITCSERSRTEQEEITKSSSHFLLVSLPLLCREGRVGKSSFTTESHPALVPPGCDRKALWDWEDLAGFRQIWSHPWVPWKCWRTTFGNFNSVFWTIQVKTTKQKIKKICLWGLLIRTLRGGLKFYSPIFPSSNVHGKRYKK